MRSRDAQPEYASEILEEFTTHRGELKRRNSNFRDGRLLQVTSRAKHHRVSSESDVAFVLRSAAQLGQDDKRAFPDYVAGSNAQA